jgi:NifU-like protein involved in Fe-S cluster formation
MEFFDRLRNIFSRNEPEASSAKPLAEKDSFIQESLLSGSQTSSELIVNQVIEHSLFVDRDRFVDHAFNLTKDIAAIYDSLKDKIQISAQELESLKDPANGIVSRLNSLTVAQLPSKLYGYSPAALEKAKSIYNERDEHLKSISAQIASFAQHSVPLGAEEAHRGVVGKLISFHTLTGKISDTNALLSFRKYPSGNSMDTIFQMDPKKNGGKLQFLHDGTGALFIQPQEIHLVELSAVSQYKQTIKDKYGNVLNFGKTDDGRHVIHQTGMRACGASVTNMILLDLGLKPLIELEDQTNLSNNQKLMYDFKRAGVTKVTEREIEYDLPWREKLDFLTTQVGNKGSLILSVGGEIGGHYIILDKIDSKMGLASIRDPYHGWAIQCSAQGIAKRFGARALAFN